MNYKDSLASFHHRTLFPAVLLETYVITPGFSMGDEALKTGSHVYEAGSLLSESSPQPPAGEILG